MGGADKKKKINMARAVFNMACLNFVLEEIKPLRSLHLDVEGWDNYELRGSGVALRGVDNTCFIACEVWDERDGKSMHLALRDAD